MDIDSIQAYRYVQCHTLKVLPKNGILMTSPARGASPLRSMSLPCALPGAARSAEPLCQWKAVTGATGNPPSARSMAGFKMSERDSCIDGGGEVYSRKRISWRPPHNSAVCRLCAAPLPLACQTYDRQTKLNPSEPMQTKIQERISCCK